MAVGQELTLPGRYEMRQTDRPRAAEGELARVLGFYDLGDLREAQWISRGFVNDNWMVETDQGRYFLKRRHPSMRQPRLISAQHDLIWWLRRTRFPAPQMIHTRGGSTFVTLAGQVYEVQHYIEGDLFDCNRPEHLDAAARTLGHYHASVAGFCSAALRELGPLYSPAVADAALAHLEKAWDLHRDRHLAHVVHQLRRCLAVIGARFEGHGVLPELVIHGDYYADNLIFDADQVAGVVDYDKACWQPRLVDLAEALIYFASSRPGLLRHGIYPGFLEWAPFHRFLQAYGAVIGLSLEEARALPDYIACIWVQVSLQRFLEQPLRPDHARESLQEVLALARWGEAKAARMTVHAKESA